MQHAEKGNLFWGDVQWVVLDEADTMFDKGFGPEVRAVLAPLRSKARPANTVLVVATLSKVENITLLSPCAADWPPLYLQVHTFLDGCPGVASGLEWEEHELQGTQQTHDFRA